MGNLRLDASWDGNLREKRHFVVEVDVAFVILVVKIILTVLVA